MSKRAAINHVSRLGSWQGCIHAGVFGELYAAHSTVRALTDRPDKTITDQVRINDGYYRSVACLYVATQRVYTATVERLAPLLSAYEDESIARLMTCYIPNFSKADAKQLIVTCRKAWLCPFCRFRQLTNIYKKLSPALADNKYIGVLPIVLPTINSIPERGDMAELLDTLDAVYHRKRCHTWNADAVLIVPKRVKTVQAENWVCVAVIVALCNQPELQLWNPYDKLGIATNWYITPASPMSLAQAIISRGSYSPELLYESMPATALATMYATFLDNSNATVRIRTHGLAKYKKLTAAQTSEITEKDLTYGFDLNKCRPASETADMGDTPRDPQGLVYGVQSDYQLSTGEKDASNISRRHISYQDS
jgi:hypothetical protein